MEKSQYLFKLNVQPSILKKYDSQMLFTSYIPNKICDVFNTLFQQVEVEHDNLYFSMPKDYKEIVMSKEYKQLLQDTDKFTKQYMDITLEYHENGGITYSKDFLEKHDTLMNGRKNLERKFPILIQANSQFKSGQVLQSIESEYDFSIDAKVGIGIDHIKKVQILKMYAEQLAGLEVKDVKISYNFASEYLTVKETDKILALDTVKDIERKINSKKDDIQDITINPIYEKLVLETTEKTRSIEITIVYPNGDTNEELKLLLKGAQQTGSKEVRTEFLASDDEKNNEFLEQINNLANEPATKGYLRSIKSQNKNIINIEETTIKTVTSSYFVTEEN